MRPRYRCRILRDTLTPAAAAVGLEVGIAVREVVVKDVILPLDLRSAYAEQVTARARGQARLEALPPGSTLELTTE